MFSSRQVERASYRDIGARFIAADTHPDHDTIAAFRHTNKAAFEAAFLEVSPVARASGLLRLGTVSIDGTRLDANASKIRSLRGACPRAGRRPDPWDRARALGAKLAADIAALTAKAEAADAGDDDPQALPAKRPRRDGAAARPSRPTRGRRPSGRPT